MSDKVSGECPKCQSGITALFNSGIIDIFGSGMGDKKPQKCPNCNVLLNIKVILKKVYSMTATEHVNPIKDNG